MPFLLSRRATLLLFRTETKKAELLSESRVRFLLEGAHMGGDGKSQEEYDEDLFNAVRSGRLERVQGALTHGADIRAGDDCALRLSMVEGQLHLVEYLAENIFKKSLWKGRTAAEVTAEANGIVEKLRLHCRSFGGDDAPAIAIVERAALETALSLGGAKTKAKGRPTKPPAPPAP
jgi:hypothetical protein